MSRCRAVISWVMFCSVFGFVVSLPTGGALLRAQEPVRKWGGGVEGRLIRSGGVEVVIRRNDGQVQAVNNLQLNDADRRYLKSRIPGPTQPPYAAAISKEAQELTEATDALVQIHYRVRDDWQVAAGVVFQTVGDQAFILGLGIQIDGEDFEAIAPRRDVAGRIKLRSYGFAHIRYDRMQTARPIFVGLRSELPAPIQVPRTPIGDAIGTKLRLVTDPIPALDDEPRTVERVVLPAAVVDRKSDHGPPRDEKLMADWKSIQIPYKTRTYYKCGLAVDAQGAPRYLCGWQDQFVSSGTRSFPLVPLDFFSSLKIGSVVAFRMGTPILGSADPRIVLDVALLPLPGGMPRVVVKAAPLPPGETLSERMAAFLRSLDTAEPPALVEVGEFKKSDVPLSAMRTIADARSLQADGQVETYSFSAPAPAAYLAGESFALVPFLRDEAGKEEICRALLFPMTHAPAKK